MTGYNRLKHVFDTRQCIHVWVQQTQATGRAFAVQFEGDTLYSYVMPIARIVPDPRELAGVALISSLAQPVTTKRHVSEARGATRHMRAFMVPDLGEHGDMKLAHQRNRAALIAETEERLSALGNFRSKYTPWTVRSAYGLRYEFPHSLVGHETALCTLIGDNDAKRYCEVFGLEPPVFERITHLDRIRAAWHAWNTPAKIAAREKRRKSHEERAVALAEQTRKALLQLEDEWRAGGGFYGRFRDLPVMLRVKGDTLETSQGAKVPLADAVRAFKLAHYWRSTAGNGADLYPKERDRRVGDFTVDRIASDGTIYACCHTIPWSESERLAQQLGIIPTATLEPSEANHPYN